MATQKTEAKVVVSAQDQTAGPLAAVEARFKSLFGPVDTLKSKLQGLNGTGLSGLREQLGGVRGQLALMGIGGLGAMYGGLKLVKSGFDAVVDTAEKADRVSDLGGRLRLNAEEFQVFEKLAKDNMASVEEVGGAFLKFRLNLGQAQAEGGKKLQALNESLAAFGLTAKEAQKMRPLDLMKQLGLTSSKSNEDADEEVKIARFRALAGKTGATLIPVFEAIGTKYDATLAKMREAGTLMTDDMAEQGGRAFKAYEKSQGAMQGLKTAFGIRMMPVFEQFSKVMEERMKANRSAMMPGVDALAEVLSQNLKPFLNDMDGLADKTSGVFKWLARLARLVGWDKLIFGGALLLISPLILATTTLAWSMGGLFVRAVLMAVPAILSLLAPIGSAVFALNVLGISGATAWLMVLGPIALIGAAIAGVAYLIYRNWGGIVAFVGAVWDGFVAAMQPVFGAFEPVVSGISEVFSWLGKLFGATSAGKDDWSAWASAGKVAGEVVAAVFKALLTPIFLVIDAIKLVVAGVSFLSGSDFKFESSTARLLGGGDQPQTAALPSGTISTSRADVGGKLDIRVTSDGQARVERVESNNPNFDIDARAGSMYAIGA
jgi:hypothetical protein